MKLAQIAHLDLSRANVSALLELPAPESLNLTGTPKQIVAALDNLFSMWQQIVISKAEIPLERFEWTCQQGHKHEVEGEELRGRLLLSVSGYFDFLVARFLAKGARKGEWPFPNALRIDGFRRFIPEKGSVLDNIRLSEFRILSFNYFFSLFGLYFTSLFRDRVVPRPLCALFESIAHDALSDLFSSCFHAVGQDEKIAARRLTYGILNFAKHVYAEVPNLDSARRFGPFSMIRLDELVPLARRDALLQRRYGVKNVERVFENQLALVMQSFGLYVVSTHIGRSTVDLVCISPTADERITFLIEAKTTKTPYALPLKDSRALRDYVSDVRRSLTTLPPLSYVLIIAFEPARTIRTKLAKLEADAAVPVRFVRAQQIAELREQITGPLPLRVFSANVLMGDGILEGSFVDAVVQSYRAEQEAHRAFVDAMLSARGVVPPVRGWATRGEHDPEEWPRTIWRRPLTLEVCGSS
jgi:hypothetical protein